MIIDTCDANVFLSGDIGAMKEGWYWVVGRDKLAPAVEIQDASGKEAVAEKRTYAEE